MLVSKNPFYYGVALGGQEKGAAYRISGLDEYRARSGEFAHEAFRRRKTGDKTTRSYSLEHIFGVPGYQVAIVDNVLLSFNKLSHTASVSQAPQYPQIEFPR